MPVHKLLPAIAFLMLLASCGIPKQYQRAAYFQDSVTEAEKIINEVPTIIKPGDRLNINITAINKSAAEAFNVTGTAGASLSGYLVDSLGNIRLLQLGVIHAAGFTAAALQDHLQQQLSGYLKGPLVTVEITNFKVSVFGEVGNPGVIAVPDGKISIIEAIVQSGDLTLFSKRQNILIIRQQDGKREFGRVDITSNQIFESPFYYLRQNDIVYVEADKTKYISNNPRLDRDLRNLGIATGLLSTVFLLVNLFNRN